MQDILRKFAEEKRRRVAVISGIALTAIISFIMLLGADGTMDPSIILNFDPIFMLALQAAQSIFLFFGIPLLFVLVILRVSFKDFFPLLNWQELLYTFLIAICGMVVISAIGEWNMNLDFGDSAFAKWARASEDFLKVVTEHLTTFSSFGHFLLAFVVIAIIPGIGEELLFRGLIQSNFKTALGSHHAAIWITGFIFAAIHLQFFGLAPRMLLGVLFGYLYHWSGKLSVAMLAHTVNNGVAVILLYLVQSGKIEMTEAQMDASAPWPAVLIFGALGTFLLVSFKKNVSIHHE